VLELRECLGAGNRVRFARHGQSIVILLCGGSKKTQAAEGRPKITGPIGNGGRREQEDGCSGFSS
jgi:putative component of toxin-antitoxin plasmid stabilization module